MDLKGIQEQIYDNKEKRGFNVSDVGKEIVLMTEELGELSRAYRDGDKEQIAEEIGDLMVYCLGLCEILDLNSEKVLKETVEDNKSREHESYFKEGKA